MQETSKTIAKHNIDLLDLTNLPSYRKSLPKPIILTKFIHKDNDPSPKTKTNKKKIKTNNQNKNDTTAHESNKMQALLKDYLNEIT